MSAVPPCQPGQPEDISKAVKLYQDFLVRTKTDSAFSNLSESDKVSFYHRLEPTLTKRYPIVFRYMIATGQFHPKAMEMYMDRLKDKPYKTEDEYCERCADYIKYLYMKTNTNYSTKEGNKIWKDTRKALKDELTDFKERLDEIKAEEIDTKKVAEYERRRELKIAIDEMRANSKN